MSLRPPVHAGDHTQGNTNATIELLEYGDYQCPHCGRAYPVVKQLQQELGHKLKFIFRNFPLEKVHPQAKLAAIISEAAALQGKYWEMHDLIFENQKRIRIDLMTYADQLGMDNAQFMRDIERIELEEKVKADFLSGMRSGVNATPSFFVNGEKFNGSWEDGELLDHLLQLAKKA